jgi:hypothetical protein
MNMAPVGGATIRPRAPSLNKNNSLKTKPATRIPRKVLFVKFGRYSPDRCDICDRIVTDDANPF